MRICFVLMALAIYLPMPARAQSTAISYQGRLEASGAPVTGAYDLTFSLYDALTGGTRLAGPITHSNVEVTDGTFTVQVDFGAEAWTTTVPPYTNAPRYLAIRVNGEPLSPRQPVTRAPYAMQTRGLHVNDDGEITVAGGFTAIGNTRAELAGDSFAGFFYTSSTTGIGVFAQANAADGPNRAIHARVRSDEGIAVEGYVPAGSMGSAIVGSAVDESGWAGRFLGRVNMSGHTAVGRQDVRITDAELFGVHTEAGESVFGGMYVSGADEASFPFYGYSAGGTSGDYDAYHYYQGTTGAWKLYVRGGTRMTVTDGGDLGIGTQSPAFKLHVNGTAGKPGGGSWSSASDARLKKNVRDLDGALDALTSLRGVSFEYIDPQTIGELEGERLGMIAQEVELVFPDWVETNDDGFRTVTYRGFEALTVEAFRELREENDREIAGLKGEVKDLEIQLDDLQARLGALEALLEQVHATHE